MPIVSLPIIGPLFSRLARLIAKFTVEHIRAEYAKELEGLKQANRLLLQQLDQKHQFKLAALDKRLKAHQKAYRLWWDLRKHLHKEEIEERIYECQEWWVDNNLYLNEEAEEAFFGAFTEAVHFNLLTSEKAPAKEIKKSFERINAAGSIIRSSVILPSWGDSEREQFKPVELPKKEGQ